MPVERSKEDAHKRLKGAIERRLKPKTQAGTMVKPAKRPYPGLQKK